MPTIVCDRKIDCLGVLDADNPITNLSAEAPDIPQFRGVAYNGDIPPGDSLWTSFGCRQVCYSYISQADADLCAARLAYACNNQPPTYNPGTFPTGGGSSPGGGGTPASHGYTPSANPPHPTVYNTVQTCTVYCADGSPFSFTVAAGTFAGPNQAAANQSAYTYACRQAALGRFCLNPITSKCCANTAYSSTIVPTGGVAPYYFALVSGALPPGLTLNATTGEISGTPTLSGTYGFSVMFTDVYGATVTRAYTIRVLQISTSTPLPEAYKDVDYAAAAVVFAEAGPYDPPLSWQVVGGALPTGMTLDETTGALTGTPTVSGTFNFTISAQDAAT